MTTHMIETEIKKSELFIGSAYNFTVIQGCYWLPQSGKLVHDLLSKRLHKEGYYETATTPGMWRHRWRPIHSVLIVDDFGVEYVRKTDANYRTKIMKTHNKISQDWEGK